MIAVALCAGLASRDAVSRPALPYGSSGEHAGFAGTLSIGQRGAVRWCSSSSSARPRRPRAVRVRARRATPSRSPPRCGSCASRATTCGPGRPRWGGDAHAGRVETSLMLALAPAARRRRSARRATSRRSPTLMPRLRAEGVRAVAPNGVLGDPAGASAEEGRELLAAAIADLRAFVGRLVARPASGGITRRGARAMRPRVASAADAARAAAARGQRDGARGEEGRARHRAPRAGSGRATVQRLSADGFNVVAVDRAEDDPRLPYALGTERRAAARSASERVVAIPADATDAEALAAVDRDRRAALGRARRDRRRRGRDRRRRAARGSSTPSRSGRCWRSTSAA